jgi:hypothetical protein
MLKGLFNKIKKFTEPETTTLLKHQIRFTTVDGKEHLFTGCAWVDPNVLRCTCAEYYLIGQKFLQDDDNIQYPMENILSIKFEPVDYKENVITKRYQVYYQEYEIKIYEKGVDK